MVCGVVRLRNADSAPHSAPYSQHVFMGLSSFQKNIPCVCVCVGGGGGGGRVNELRKVKRLMYQSVYIASKQIMDGCYMPGLHDQPGHNLPFAACILSSSPLLMSCGAGGGY